MSASPDDQPAGHLGQECPGDERSKENRAGKPAALGNNPGGSNGLRARSVLKEASRAPGTDCRQPGAVIPVRGSRAADDSGDRVTLGGFSSWPSRASAVATEPTPKSALGKVRKAGLRSFLHSIHIYEAPTMC